METIPQEAPYLTAPEESAMIVGLEQESFGRPVVGVCWGGNPGYQLDYRRSVPLRIFERVLRVPGVRFISLQRELRPGDAEILAGLGNIDVTRIGKAEDFSDTAALIAKLDLVISVDTGDWACGRGIEASGLEFAAVFGVLGLVDGKGE